MTGTRRSLTVQGWLTLVLSVMGVLVLAGSVAGLILLKRSDAVSHELIDEIQPSRSASYRLQAALRDQETSVRGYLITADPSFLTPYYDGVKAEQTAAEDIRLRVGDRQELIGDVDAIEAAAGTWRSTFADPVVASVTPGAPDLVARGIVEGGKSEFDRIRSLFDVQNQHLADARAAGLDQIEQVRAWRDTVLIGIVIAIVVTAILLAVMVRRAVTRPLDALAAACRRITEGNFGETIVPQGPKDIRSIATDVENMRQRIVDELDASLTARAQLTEQAETLDEQTVELRRSNAELEQFAYVASHDLQEPLRKVASFCQLLERRYGDKLDDRGIEYIAFAVDGAKRMQVLINDLLTFSRVGRLNAASTDVDLAAALDEAMSNLTTALDESGATVVRPEKPLPHVLGDGTLLTMLWQNLIGNAVKFQRQDTSPRIAIDCKRGTEDYEGQWLFTVSDNGIGIGDEFVDKVFVIFQRLHGRDAYAGTGIGLALCKKIVEHHGGEIWIDTSYTEGARLSFTLPVFVPQTDTKAAESRPAPSMAKASVEGTKG